MSKSKLLGEDFDAERYVTLWEAALTASSQHHMADNPIWPRSREELVDLLNRAYHAGARDTKKAATNACDAVIYATTKEGTICSFARTDGAIRCGEAVDAIPLPRIKED